MSSIFKSLASYLSKRLGLESVNSFPSRHRHARTNWGPAYFDIPYGTTPEDIERRMCIAIGNTPTIFSRINNPTPRMQRALLAVVEERLQRNDRTAGDLMELLIASYASPHVQEAVPGLRAEIEASAYGPDDGRVRRILSFLLNMQAPFNAIDERQH